MSKKLLVFFSILIQLNILDLVTTWCGVALGARETNPNLPWVNIHGVGIFDVILKIIVTSIQIGFVLILYKLPSVTNVNGKWKIVFTIMLGVGWIVVLGLTAYLFYIVCRNFVMLDGQIKEVWKALGETG